jgi:hypothetical protein
MRHLSTAADFLSGQTTLRQYTTEGQTFLSFTVGDLAMIRRLTHVIVLGTLLATTSAFAAKDCQPIQTNVTTNRDLVSLGPQPEPPDRPSPERFDPIAWLFDLIFRF